MLVGQGDCYDGCYWGDYFDYDEGDGDFGYTLHAGWRFHQYGALEVSYLDAGPIGWDKDLVYMPEFNDYYNNRIEYSARVTEVTVLGILPFGEMFEVYAKLGAAFSEGRACSASTSRSATRSSRAASATTARTSRGGSASG